MKFQDMCVGSLEDIDNEKEPQREKFNKEMCRVIKETEDNKWNEEKRLYNKKAH